MNRKVLSKKIRDSTTSLKDFNEKNIDKLEINFLEHQKDFKGKLISENKRFDEKIEHTKTKFLSSNTTDKNPKKRFLRNKNDDILEFNLSEKSNYSGVKNKILNSKETKNNINDFTDSSLDKKASQKKSNQRIFKENTDANVTEVYNPLNKDLDNDGVIDRYDNNINSSDYFSSTYDVEKENSKEVITQTKNKRKNYFKNEIFTRDKNKTQGEKVEEVLAKSKESNIDQSLDDVDSLLGARDKKLKKLKSKKDNLLNKKVPKDSILYKSNKKMLGAMASSAGILSSYISHGSHENVGAEASEKSLDKISQSVSTVRKFSRNRKSKLLKRQESKVSNLNKRIRKRKYKLEYKDKLSSLIHTDSYKQKTIYKRFIQRKQMKKLIYQKYEISFRDRVKKKVQDILVASSKLVVNNAKKIVGVLVGFLILFMMIFQLISSIGGIFGGTGNNVLATSYLASEPKLLSINQSYSTKELNLENELARVEASNPGYDEYIIHNNIDISHDTHLLLSYITSRFGEAENMNEVEAELESLFKAIYDVEYKEEIEIRYKTEYYTTIDEDGNEILESIEVPYEYKKLIVTVSKNDMKNEILSRLQGYPDNIKHFEMLYETKGNMSRFFSDANSPVFPSGVSSLYDFDVSGGDFPQPDPNYVASLNGGYPGQCTWYVYNRFSQLGKPIKHSPMGNGGEWAFYAQNYGYSVSRNARAGTAISFPPGVAGSSPQYGHIAFVEKVNEDGSVLVSEMNVKGEFIISTRTISKEDASQCYYIDYGL
ncbi:CD1108 family mobile element protein [Gemella sp. zg-1178]|uniref:CHAP domain-containing protein n=1 Tax=Gemella sp. zg-1178 TaxID=2840372 RepID=UPI00207B5713|nr:CHAP domain-containing protein [Gemella sp. zg-1178]